MRHVVVPVLALAAVVLMSPDPVAARPFPPEALPPDLAPWVPWVLDGAPDRACPVVGGAAVCVWPSRLALEVGDGGGGFTFDVTTDREATVPLPGGPGAWPQAVVGAGDAPVVVLDRDQRPFAVLPAGDHRLRGRFAWKRLPESIPVPPVVARVELSVAGRAVAFPRRDDDGLLWVRAREDAADGGDTLELEVFRKVADGVPVVVTTRIVIRASGRPREVDLGAVLVPGTVPLSVTADLPARIDVAGTLRVQVRAGTWNLEILARTAGDAPEAFTAPKREDPWPAEEVWVFQPDDALRQVTVSGAPGVDPSRTGLREDWRRLPAYLVAGGASLAVRTERRGEPEPPPSSLALSRDVWLDLDGKGYTIRDRIQGRLTRDWRLDLGAPAVLGHAAVDGEDLLVTTDPRTAAPGVELRRGEVSLVAESRIEAPVRTLPAVGWSTDVRELDVRLHLAPGWSLLSAGGVDRLPGTWVDRWTLLSFLFVLLVSLAVARLVGWPWGLLALAALALNQHEPGRPYWVWVSLLAALGLLRVVPEGRFRIAVRAWWAGTLVVLAAVVVPFVVHEVRTGLYPQVGAGAASADVGLLSREDGFVPAAAPMDPKLAAEVNQAVQEAKEDEAEEVEAGDASGEKDKRAGSYGGLLSRKAEPPAQGKAQFQQNVRARRQALQNDPNAVVQTGPGVPAWSWSTARLDWSGPVEAGHTVRLWLVSPAWNLVLALLRVLLTLVLAGVLARAGWRALPPRPRAEAPGASVAAAIVVLLFAWASPGIARADVPAPDVLRELQDRLLRPESCLPDCRSTSHLEIAAREGLLTLRAEVHAGTRIDWPVPGPARSWVPASVTVDGRDAAMALLDDGFLHVRLGPGRHVVEASGPLPPLDALALELADAPHRVDATAVGWDVEGIREDGRAQRSVRLVRHAPPSGDAAAEPAAAPDPGLPGGAPALPPWLEVTRTLDVGMPWLVQTTVRRVSPTGSPVVIRVPLLPGESVTDSDLRVEGRDVVVSLGRDETEVSWDATLQETESLALAAPRGMPWSETWVLRCSPIWQCDATGLSPVRHQQEGRWEPVFRPYPGETLTLAFRRPAGAAGQSVTLDSAELHWAPGTRLSEATLVVLVRNSQGGAQTFTLPPDAQVRKVTVDGREEPIRQEGARLSVGLHPGRQRIEVAWQQPDGIAAFSRAPAVGLGAPAANTQVVVTLPAERWLLLAGGPSWGPAVLFWGLLIAAVLAAIVLGRLPFTPLRTWQWVLLAAGLTLVPVWAALVVAAWFLALQWRGTRPQPDRPVLRNLVQVLLALWTVAALACLYAAVHAGLLLQPDMQVSGAGSSAGRLAWFAGRVPEAMPRPWVLSLPRLVWQGTLLAWSLWLAWSLVKWLPWAWRCWSEGGLWTRRRKPPAGFVPPVPPATDAPTPPPGA